MIVPASMALTNSTTFTSPSGVRREISRYTRPAAAAAAAGLLAVLVHLVLRFASGP